MVATRSDDAPAAEPAPPRGASWPGALWRRWGWLVRWGGTLAGVLYISRVVELARLKAAFAAVSPLVLIGGLGNVAFGIVLGAVRWRVALRAYGARSRPSLATALRLYFIALFYNTYLPGAVGGDVVRAVVTRDSFADGGTTGALAVVFIERALGLFAVFALVLTGLALAGDTSVVPVSLRLGSPIGGAVALAAVVLLPYGRELARFLPGPLARIAGQLPSVVRWLDFAAAAALSLGTQLVAVITGWLILRDLHAGVTFADALLIVPAALATAYLPFTIGGTGARELVFAQLAGSLIGMAKEDAVAASLLLWSLTLLVGAIGGVLVLLGRNAPRQP